VTKQYHHIFGRANGSDISDIVVLCGNCHDRISSSQNLLPPKTRRKGASKRDKSRFMLVSMGSLLELIGTRIKKMGLESYGDSGKGL
jgi:hypothetical protein